MTAPARAHTARQLQGYAMVGGSFLIMGSIGALVDYASAPESMLLVLRMAVAGVVLGVIFARRRPLAGLRTPGVPLRLLTLCVVDTLARPVLFVSLRMTNVAIGMFLTFTAPVWVALMAPRVLRTRTEPIVYVAVVIALAGLATIVVPSLSGQAVRVSALGLFLGAGSGLGYATFQMLVKGLSRQVSSVTIVLSETVVDGLLLLPLALWQTVAARLLADPARPAGRRDPGRGVHGAGLHAVDRGPAPRARAARLHSRLPRAGLGACLRAAPARRASQRVDPDRWRHRPSSPGRSSCTSASPGADAGVSRPRAETPARKA